MKFSDLYQRYRHMAEPSYSLSVGGRELEVGRDVRLVRAVCELTCRPSAGYLLLEAVMDPEGTHAKAWLGAFQAGAVCSFSLGYGSSRALVFQGFLYDVSWEDPLARGPLRLEALFLDVRGRLMASSCPQAGSARTLSQVVRAILGQSCCGQLASSITIQNPPQDWDLPLLRSGRSDYQVVSQAAAFLGYEFYAWAQELYFGPARPKGSPAVFFTDPTGLILLRRRTTLVGQCAAVAVSGADDQGMRISARQARDRDTGFGTAGMPAALSLDLCQVGPTVRTMAQAQYLAKARMQEIQRRAGGVTGRCLGLPELRPGRFIGVSGLSQAVNGTYYIHTVRHTLDAGGCETYFEGEV